jgi:RNA polymerase sigma-70 factor (ECF subfamily)
MPTNDKPRERFEELFRTFHPAVRAYARRRVPGASVDDIVSETFLVAWRRLERVPDDPLPWLLAVARNAIGTERRGANRRLRLWTEAQAHLRTAEGLDPVTAEEGDGRVLAAMARLRERDREALTLVAWDGLTPSEAAAVLGEPAVRFRVRLHRASRRLRLELEIGDAATATTARPGRQERLTSKGASA